jgi:dTDP-D-glucose 4,6-dehydratase
MTILITGGAGFIGGNFILDWLAQSEEPVVNLDKLTYAGNPETLSVCKAMPVTPCFKAPSETVRWSNACWSNIARAR